MIDTLVWFNLARHQEAVVVMKSLHLFNIGCAGFVTAFSQTNDKGMKLYLKEFAGSKLRKS